MRSVTASLLSRSSARPLARLLCLCVLAGFSVGGQAQTAGGRVALATSAPQSLAAAADAGALPGSQRMALTLTLAPPADRQAALQQMLVAQTTVGSASYHHWLTPAEFAASYGATADELAGVSSWAQSQGLSVDAVSPSGLRVSVSGTAAQVGAALAVDLRLYQVSGTLFFSNRTQPSLPAAISASVVSLEGLSTVPPSGGPGAGLQASAQEHGTTVDTVSSDFASLAGMVDRNAASLVRISSGLCAADVSAAQLAQYSLLFQEANAQGMTLLASHGCAAGGFPASLPEVTAVAPESGATADTVVPSIARPAWQFGAGLPADGLRYAPDLAVSSLAALSETLTAIVTRQGVRQGNVNPVLYRLSATPGLYTQPDGAAAGTWEAATGLGVVDLAKLARAYPQGSTATSVQVAASAASPTHGQPVTFSATVSFPSGGPVPSNTVTFSSAQAGFTSSSVALNANGVATTAAYLLPGGSYTVTATYSGDGNYAQSSGTASVTVQAEAANFTLSAPSTVALGASVTVQATLSSASGFGTPAGTVTVTPSGLTGTSSAAQTQTLVGSGASSAASFLFSANHAGSASFQGSCTPSDSSFTCYTSQSALTTVAQGTPTVALTTSNSSPSAGTSVTYTANVTGVGTIAPTGTINFKDGGTAIGSGSAPTATATVTLAPGVTHSITAVYAGDSNYITATSAPQSPTVGTAATTTAATLSSASIVYGAADSLNVTVTPSAAVNGAAPTGTLTFTGAGTLLTAAVAGAQTSVPLPTTLAVGSYTIGTTYGGDSNYAASTANAVTLTVTPAVGTLQIAPSTTTFTNGSTSTVTVTVQLPGNTQLPAGSTFTVMVGTAQRVTGTFAANPGGNSGTGAVTLQAPAAGTYTVAVSCSINTNITCTPGSFSITSTATTTTTTTTGTTATTTTLVSSAASATAGQSLTLTATVAASATAVAANPIAGTVSFFDGTTLLGSAAVGANGVATLSAALTATGTNSLTATYNGSTVYAPSTSPAVPVTAVASPAAITLTTSSSGGLAGSAVTFTARVTGATTTGTAPTGTVSFYLAGTPSLLATVSLTSGGAGVSVATFTTTGFPAGTQTVYAVYSGDTNFTTVTSAGVALGFTDYNLTFLPQTLTLSRGSSGQVTLVLGIVNGFSGTVVFGCTPPPNTLTTCSFSPTTLVGGGSSTMTITTTAAGAQLHPPSGPGHPGAGVGIAGGLSLAAVLCLMLPGRGRRRLPTMLLVLLAIGATVNLGCGDGSFAGTASTASSSGTPLGTAIFTINTAGTDGTNTVKHNYSFQVTVQ